MHTEVIKNRQIITNEYFTSYNPLKSVLCTHNDTEVQT